MMTGVAPEMLSAPSTDYKTKNKTTHFIYTILFDAFASFFFFWFVHKPLDCDSTHSPFGYLSSFFFHCFPSLSLSLSPCVSRVVVSLCRWFFIRSICSRLTVLVRRLFVVMHIFIRWRHTLTITMMAAAHYARTQYMYVYTKWKRICVHTVQRARCALMQQNEKPINRNAFNERNEQCAFVCLSVSVSVAMYERWLWVAWDVCSRCLALDRNYISASPLKLGYTFLYFETEGERGRTLGKLVASCLSSSTLTQTDCDSQSLFHFALFY